MSSPTIVVQRRVPYSEEPVPLEGRRGMLWFDYAVDLTTRVREHQSKVGNVFPQGLDFWYGTGFKLYVEVLPRGLNEIRYSQLIQHPPYIQQLARVKRLRLRETPIVASDVREPVRGGDTGTWSDAHITLLKPGELLDHLKDALPIIGVAPSNIDAMLRYITSVIERGKIQLSRR
jgi:hypothetical protein